MKNTFTFGQVPQSVEELKALPEFKMDTPFKTAALTMIALCNYKNDVEETIKMLDVLKGPGEVSVFEKQFLKDRLEGKEYKPYSYFEGATVDNNYEPTVPYTISVEDNPYSYSDENYATMHVVSSGADQARQIKLRKKPSTGEWFLLEIQCLSDIREPKALDPWA